MKRTPSNVGPTSAADAAIVVGRVVGWCLMLIFFVFVGAVAGFFLGGVNGMDAGMVVGGLVGLVIAVAGLAMGLLT